MIRAEHGWVARFIFDHDERYLPILAWRQDGTYGSDSASVVLDGTRVSTVKDVCAERRGVLDAVIFDPSRIPTGAEDE